MKIKEEKAMVVAKSMCIIIIKGLLQPYG